MATTETRVRFRMTPTVLFALGLDDDGYVKQCYPTMRESGNDYSASAVDAKAILDLMRDHANDVSGFEHTARERRALGLSADRLALTLAAPDSSQ